MMNTILVVAAHPDDEVLGCGGTIARFSESTAIHILILGEGCTSRYDSRSEASKVELERIGKAARSAAKVLGAQSITLESFPDNQFDEPPLLSIVKCVEKVLDEIRPDVVYTHHPSDLNIDHKITFQAVLTATRPLPNCSVKELYTFETPSATEWSFHQNHPVFKPNVFIDVSQSIEIKLQAMEFYETEIRSFPHPRSLEALKAICRRWGTVVSREYVEAFELVRWVG
jgi:LmbE family N-acetylglucosaminyl deacetylase